MDPREQGPSENNPRMFTHHTYGARFLTGDSTTDCWVYISECMLWKEQTKRGATVLALFHFYMTVMKSHDFMYNR